MRGIFKRVMEYLYFKNTNDRRRRQAETKTNVEPLKRGYLTGLETPVVCAVTYGYLIFEAWERLWLLFVFLNCRVYLVSFVGFKIQFSLPYRV